LGSNAIFLMNKVELNRPEEVGENLQEIMEDGGLYHSTGFIVARSRKDTINKSEPLLISSTNLTHSKLRTSWGRNE
jgi:hypothetical protein